MLVYELRESQNLAETHAAVSRLNQIQEAQVVMATSETLAAIRVKATTEGVQALNPVELYRLQRWENTVRVRMHSQYIQYIRGYLDKKTAERFVGIALRRLP